MGKSHIEVWVLRKELLKFVKADLAGSTKDYQDGFVKKIQESMARIKGSREMEERFMLLDDFGPVPDELRKNILEEKDMDILLKYLKLAAHTDSLADFIDGMSKI